MKDLVPLPVCLTADIEFEIRDSLSYPLRCAPVAQQSVLREVNGESEGLRSLLSPLRDHSLPATFFVEVMQSLHFGPEPMQQIISQARIAPLVDFQMHIHPCWGYLASKDWQQTVTHIKKNDSMAGRGVRGSSEVLSRGIELFKNLLGKTPLAFRSGSLKVDLDLLQAQAEVGIPISSCVGVGYSLPNDDQLSLWSGIARIGSVTEIPVTSYEIKMGNRLRPKLLTVTGTPFSLMKRILEDAWKRQAGPVVFLTHASEMAADITDVFTPPLYAPIPRNQLRWRKLCAYLDANRDRYQVLSMGTAAEYWMSLKPVRHQPYQGGISDLCSIGISRILGRA